MPEITLNQLPTNVRIVEVGPRDGLQNEKEPVDTQTKLELIARLARSGLRNIEATAFVSPRWVPQMADSAQVLAGAMAFREFPDVTYPVLTPNLKGLQAAIEQGVQEVAVFGAASESFSQKNINCSIQESLARFAPVAETARKHSVKVRGYISCVVECPYEGPVAPQAVAQVARALLDMGCYEISLGDTIGTGTPVTIQKMIQTVASSVPIEQLAGHYHDTYGMALANILASLEMGMSTFDASVSGLGGCPYAAGASGNVATEDVVWLLSGLGVETGVDLEKLVETAAWISLQLGREPGSKVARAILAKSAMAQSDLP